MARTVELTEPVSVDPNFVNIFIGIKTSDQGRHAERLPQIRKTWLKDALKMGVTIKFFSDEVTGMPAIAKQENQSVSADIEINMESLMVPIKRCVGTDFRCKTEAMFKYFLEHDQQSAFFCNFDDDNYVLVANLLKVLTAYHRKGIRDLYVRRESQRDGFRLGEKFNRTVVHFLTGGAGYCISRELIEKGKKHFTAFPRELPDDIAVGYIVQEKLP